MIKRAKRLPTSRREYNDVKGRVELQRHVVAQLHMVEADAGEAEAALNALLDDEASKLRIFEKLQQTMVGCIQHAQVSRSFSAMYTEDAILIPGGMAPAVPGPEAITKFWEGSIRAGFKDHTFEIVETRADGDIRLCVVKLDSKEGRGRSEQ